MRRFFLSLIILFSLNLHSNVEERIIEELKEIFIMDDGRLPEVKSIKEFLSLAVERGYIKEDAVRSLHLGVVGAELVQPENIKSFYNTPYLSINFRTQDTGRLSRILRLI